MNRNPVHSLKRKLTTIVATYRRTRLHIDNKSILIGRNTRIFNLPRSHLILGKQIVLDEGVRIRGPGKIYIGDSSHIHSYSLLDARGGTISIGSHCSVNDYCIIYGHGNVTIGDGVRIAAHTIIVSANHRFDDPETPIRLQGMELKAIVVEDNVWIGANVCLLAGVTVGSGAIIGAGAVVANSIPAMSVAVGNPARVIKMRV